MSETATPAPVEWICTECAEKSGGRWRPGHLGTFHWDTCGVCRERKVVTQPRDWGVTVVRPARQEEARAERR